MAQQKEGFRTYLLRNVPLLLYRKAKKKAEKQGRSLRVYIILLLERDLDEEQQKRI